MSEKFGICRVCGGKGYTERTTIDQRTKPFKTYMRFEDCPLCDQGKNGDVADYIQKEAAHDGNWQDMVQAYNNDESNF